MPQDKKPIPVFDGHVDRLYWSGRPPTSGKILADSLLGTDTFRAGGVRVIISAVYCPDDHNGPKSALPFLERQLEQHKALMADMTPIGDSETLDSVWTDDNGLGWIGLLENADALADLDPTKLRRHNIRIIGLTHAGPNRLADGNAVPIPAGLTPVGKQIVDRLTAEQMIIDLAHLAPPGIFQVLDRFSGPVISSHTGLRRYCDTPRNLTLEQVGLIAERGGIVGISANPDLLRVSSVAALADVFAQIDTVVQRFGPNAVAIGSDYGGFDPICDGLESPAAFQSLVKPFIRAGYPDKAVEAIMGANWRGFYETHCAHHPI